MSYQYYPTGAHTAARMWSLFKRPIRHLCDPSAGKGHLIRHAKAGFEGVPDDDIPWLRDIPQEDPTTARRRSYNIRELARKKFDGTFEISAVEIDLQHHASLKELGAKIVGYDFLQVRSLATATHIIMNPPYASGVEHVLHAWDVVYDAEIVAIINAQSIRNPSTQDRRRLLDLIERHGSVEFLQSQFVDDVERKTDVEVALIYLEKVPAEFLDMDSLLGGLRRGDNLGEEIGGDIDPQVCTALALPSNFIQDTVSRYQMAVRAARNASIAAAVAHHLRDGLGVTLEQMQAKGVSNDYREKSETIRLAANDAFSKSYADLKQRAWAQIIRSSLLTDRLSNQARRKIEASAASIYELEFSAANVHGFLAGVIASMGDIYQDMVCDLFDTIIERSSDNVVFYKSWKSNQRHRIGMRIRRTRFIIPRFSYSAYSKTLDYESRQFLSDIDKVFGYLMGVTTAYDGLVHGFQHHAVDQGQRISTRFFDFRFYAGAGTIHFYPRSSEVVEKINRFVGRLRNWLPGDMQEANADFCQQYDNGEALTKDYLSRYAKSRSSYGYDSPARQLLRAIKGQEVEETQLDRLDTAINEVHQLRGLQCGHAIATVDAYPALQAPVSDDLTPVGSPGDDACVQDLLTL